MRSPSDVNSFSLIYLLRSFISDGLLSINKVDQRPLKGWIAIGDYYVIPGAGPKNFQLQVRKEEQFLASLAHDIDKMSCASFESIEGVSKERIFPRSVGWMMIRCYYAAYFSAHALLRFYGISCSQFYREETQRINSVLSLTSQNLSYQTAQGYFRLQYDKSSKNIECIPLDRSHKGLWNTFLRLIRDLSEKISIGNFLKSDKDDAVSFLDSLEVRLTSNGAFSDGNWLSDFRNIVNYQHIKQAWFPKKNNSSDKLFVISKDWKKHQLEYKNLKNESELFVDTCCILVQLNRLLVENICSIRKESPFLDNSRRCLSICNKTRGRKTSV